MTSQNQPAISSDLQKLISYFAPSDSNVTKSVNLIFESERKSSKVNADTISQALKVCLHLANIGALGEIVLYPLLHYPLVLGDITLPIIHKEYGNVMYTVCEINLDIFRAFESFLPWNNVSPIMNIDKDNKKTNFQKDKAHNRLKAFLALSKVPEIAVSKLIDRLYLLEFVEQLLPEKDLRVYIAKDTLDIHAQVAEMLGIWSIKSRLEDLSFKQIDRDRYKSIAMDLDEKLEVRAKRIERAKSLLQTELTSYGLQAEVTGRPKHIYGIMLKMDELALSVSEVNDIQGLRIIIKDGNTEEETKQNCFLAVSILHQLWHPVSDLYENHSLIRDWISNPKPNGYQSIHTTVEFEGRMLEVQIRSKKMHDWAENGLAAHWIYKKVGNSMSLQQKYLDFTKKIAVFKAPLLNDDFASLK